MISSKDYSNNKLYKSRDIYNPIKQFLFGKIAFQALQSYARNLKLLMNEDEKEIQEFYEERSNSVSENNI